MGPTIAAGWLRRSTSLAYRERNPKVAGSECPSLACQRACGIRLKDHPAVIYQSALGDGSVRALVAQHEGKRGFVHSPSIMPSIVFVVVRHG